MGYYINPPAETRGEALQGKSKWLDRHGVALDKPPAWNDIPDDCCAVCCVQNGPFEAAAIAYSPQELDAFSDDPTDTRSRKWFVVEKTLAVEYSNISMKDFAS